MKELRVIVIALSLLVILSLATVVWAQVSTNFDLSWHVLAGGGGDRQSPNYLVQDTLGQWVGDTSSCGRREVQAGFWYGVVLAPSPDCKVSLPLTLRNFVPCFEGPWEVEPNDTYDHATGPLCSDQNYSGRGYPNQDNDFFRIDVPSQRPITVTVTNLPGQGVQLQLYYQLIDDAHWVGWDNEPPYEITCPSSGPPEGKPCTGAAGVYYIRIFTRIGNSTTSYTLRATFP